MTITHEQCALYLNIVLKRYFLLHINVQHLTTNVAIYTTFFLQKHIYIYIT